jgi:hypothetical protein
MWFKQGPHIINLGSGKRAELAERKKLGTDLVDSAKELQV